MPGPFPGMDPWLEDPATWPDVHLGLIAGIRSMLNESLPVGYVARSELRCQILPVERTIIPDTFVIETPTHLPARQNSGGAALLDYDPPWIIEELAEEPVERYLEIRHVETGSRVVTMIEILSPTNKTPGNGRQEYLKKQHAALQSETHPIEIDLLRGGQYTLAAPFKQPTSELPWDYAVCLHRGQEGRRFGVWYIPVRQRLPRITIPLDPGVSEVTLDLQEALNRCYEQGGYTRMTDYSRHPMPPLSAEDAAWADALLRARGLR